MKTLSDTFALTRILNLPDRTDRLREVRAQLKLLGMDFTPGKVELYHATRPTELAGFDSLGTRGCFLSHLDVLRDARNRQVESILVMEDDCEVLPRHCARIGQVAAELQHRPWHFAYFGHLIPPPTPLPATGLAECNGPIQMAHLYAIHKSVLPEVVAYLEACLTRPGGDPIGGPMPVDGALTMFRAAHPHLTTLIAQPVLALQRSSRSDITFRSYERLPVIKQALTAARRARRHLQSA